MGSRSRRWLNQSTYSRVAYSTWSRLRHGPFGRMSSVLYRPMTDLNSTTRVTATTAGAGSYQRDAGQPLSLGSHRIGDVAPSMADLHDEQTGESVEVPAAGLVPEIAALAFREYGNRPVSPHTGVREVGEQVAQVGARHNARKCTRYSISNQSRPCVRSGWRGYTHVRSAPLPGSFTLGPLPVEIIAVKRLACSLS